MMETLSTNLTGPQHHVVGYRRSNPTGSFSAFWSNDYVQEDGSRVTLRERTPHYTARMKRGELIPFTHFEQTFEKKAQTMDQHFIYQAGSSYYEDYANGLGIESGFDNLVSKISASAWKDSVLSSNENDRMYYVQAAAAAIYASGFDALTFAAEFRDVFRLFRRIEPRFVRALSRNGKVDPRWSAKKYWRKVSNDYMEERYGWRLLMYDLVDLQALIGNLRKERFDRYKKRMGSDSFSSTSVSYDSPAYSYGDSRRHMRWETMFRMDVGVRGSVCADILPPQIALDIDVTLWEKTKLSFVLDWVVNVGQTLNALHFLATTTKYTAASGLRFALDAPIAVSGVIDSGSVQLWDIDATASYQYEYNVRVPTSVPWFPVPKLNLDPLKVVDLISIVSQHRR
jgi:hypothetical protein